MASYIYIHPGRLQSLDWTSELDWWTGLVDWTGGLTLKIIFMLSNETHLPVGLHDAQYYPQTAFFLDRLTSCQTSELLMAITTA